MCRYDQLTMLFVEYVATSHDVKSLTYFGLGWLGWQEWQVKQQWVRATPHRLRGLRRPTSPQYRRSRAPRAIKRNTRHSA